MSELINYLTQLQQDGLAIHTVYDIGAHTGLWSRSIKNYCLSQSDFYLFEANPTYKCQLDTLTDMQHFTGVLASPWQETVQWYEINGTGDSYYQENSKHYANVSSQELSCKTLSQIVAYNDLPQPDFIKLDTQGSELDILAGADSLLANTHLVLLEMPMVSYNKGAPTIQQYMDFMHYRGFIPTGIMEEHLHFHCLLQIDLMFINLKTRAKLYGSNLPNYF